MEGEVDNLPEQPLRYRPRRVRVRWRAVEMLAGISTRRVRLVLPWANCVLNSLGAASPSCPKSCLISFCSPK